MKTEESIKSQDMLLKQSRIQIEQNVIDPVYMMPGSSYHRYMILVALTIEVHALHEQSTHTGAGTMYRQAQKAPRLFCIDWAADDAKVVNGDPRGMYNHFILKNRCIRSG